MNGTANMDSRERTLRAIERQAVDRIPIDFWASNGTRRKITERFGISYDAFLDKHGVDLRYIEGPRYTGPPLRSGCDMWGVERKVVEVSAEGGYESYSEVARSPLEAAQSVEDIEGYAGWPSPDWFDYGAVAEQCQAIRGEGRAVVFMGDRLNRVAQLKPAMYLRGLENLFIDLAANPEMAEALLARIRSFYCAYLERILDAAKGGIDIVLTGDDFGGQQGLLMAPDMWRHYLRDGFAQYLGIIRAHGAKSMHHTCGGVLDIIPDFIGAGLDVLQSIQPEAENMALEDLRARFGGALSFHGGISIQRTMPFGTPESIRAEVERITRIVKPGSGYIFCTAHNIQADTPIENITALLQAYQDFGA